MRHACATVLQNFIAAKLLNSTGLVYPASLFCKLETFSERKLPMKVEHCSMTYFMTGTKSSQHGDLCWSCLEKTYLSMNTETHTPAPATMPMWIGYEGRTAGVFGIVRLTVWPKISNVRTEVMVVLPLSPSTHTRLRSQRSTFPVPPRVAGTRVGQRNEFISTSLAIRFLPFQAVGESGRI